MAALVRRAAPVVGIASASALTLLRRRWWASVIIEDLLGAPGGPTSGALAINDTGVIVGAGSGRGFRWADGRTTWLTEFGVGSRTTSIDDSGTMTGARFSRGDDLHPVRWDPDGNVRPLPLPEGGWIGTATGLSDSLTVGWCGRAGRPSARTAWVWDGGSGHALTASASGRAASGEAAAVSRSGMIVGWANDVGSTVAQVWGHATADPVPLAGLGGHYSRALACNTRGEIAGFATSPTGDDQACIWTAPTAPAHPLPTLAGAGSRALGMNDSGLVVGWSLADTGFPHACAWEPVDRPIPIDRAATGISRARPTDYVVHDLGTLGGQTSEAVAANADGAIVGLASRGRGAISMPIRPGGWSWEDRAFRTVLDEHRS